MVTALREDGLQEFSRLKKLIENEVRLRDKALRVAADHERKWAKLSKQARELFHEEES